MISVLIPTIPGREAELFQVTAAYKDQHGDDVEVLTILGYSWGTGCNLLAAEAKGDYLLCATDDTVPWEGWFEAGRPLVDEGYCPASRYLHPDGTPLHTRDERPHMADVDWTRSWLITPQVFREIGPMIDATWWADIDYSERMIAAGYPIVGCDGFAWTHLPTERDWLTPDEEQRQREVYEQHRRPDIPRHVPFWNDP